MKPVSPKTSVETYSLFTDPTEKQMYISNFSVDDKIAEAGLAKIHQFIYARLGPIKMYRLMEFMLKKRYFVIFKIGDKGPYVSEVLQHLGIQAYKTKRGLTSFLKRYNLLP